MKKLLAAAVIAAAPFAAMAGTVSDQFDINVTVVEYCELNQGAPDISFDYNPLQDSYTGTTSTSTVIDCVNGTTYNVNYPPSVQLQNTNGDTITALISLSNNDSTDSNGDYISTGQSTITYNVSIDTSASNTYVAGTTYTGTVSVTINY